MLTNRTQTPFRLEESEPVSDRAMLVFQYLTAVVAVIAAALLAFIN